MATEIISSAAANTMGNLATEYASPYLSYFFRFGKIVEDFKNRRKELELKKIRVKNDVDAAIRRTELIEEDVKDWLERTEKELREAQSLDEEIECKKCFSWCPNWGWRYFLSKKVAKKSLCIFKLLETPDFPRVGYRAPLQGIEFFPSKGFMPSGSSSSTLNEIMKAVETNGVNMIGLYGMPGVGKTTLAKEVGKHVKEQKLFDIVTMVTMSLTPNINKIQDKIADLLGLRFEATTEEGKAEELWRRLKAVKKIFIIIDDVWNEFELRTIGIPFDVEHDGCKILLTTRLQRVCVRMNCQEKFQLDILSQSEAWALFKNNACLEHVSSTVNEVAMEVASECKGLPLAIVTIGKALKGASLDGWRAANRRLEDSRHLDDEDVCEGLYTRLQFSYDYLKGENIQSCFLLCSLFPEDFDIGFELLIMLVIGHGLFSHIYLIEDLRAEIREALRKLQESGLLMKTGDSDYNEDDEFDEFASVGNERYVRMHDVLRDFAHWIASRERNKKNKFMVKEELRKWPPIRESFESLTAISFWSSDINDFPENLEFPKLEIFYFSTKYLLIKVPSALFEGMKALRVLYLEYVKISLDIFEFATDLRSLWFVECRLKNISLLRNLKKLEILALVNNNVFKLPEELVELQSLKSLHFSCFEECHFSPNLLSRLTSLQELHVTSKNVVNLSELRTLSGLTALSLRVSTGQCFPENFVFPKLQSYIIVDNGDLPAMPGLTFRILKIDDCPSSLSAFKELFRNVEKLTLNKVLGHENIVPKVDVKGLNGLTSLELSNWDDMECLVDTAGVKRTTIAFSNLTRLYMNRMPRLKALWHGQPPVKFLQKLKDVLIQNCEQLKVVFKMDGVLEWEELIRRTPLLSNLTRLELFSLPELKSIWELQPTHQNHASLQSLKIVIIQYCGELKSIFSSGIAQSLLHLKILTISSCLELEQVFDFPQEISELPESPLSELTWLKLESLPKLRCIWKGLTCLVSLTRLKTMIITWCSKLTCLFSTRLAQSLVHLEVLQIGNCHSLEYIMVEEAENGDGIVSSMDAGYSLSWPKLRTFEISSCGSLTYVFPMTLAQGLPNLESVDIANCSQLKQVFSMTKLEEGGHRPQQIVLKRLQILKFENLENLDRFCPENFVMSLSLTKFIVHNCPQLSQQAVTTAQADLEETRNCMELVSLTSVLQNLKKVRVIDCVQLQELFQTKKLVHDMKENQAPLLSNLTSLELKFLPELKWVCKEPSQYVNLQNLKVAEISYCNKLKYLFSPSLAQSLVLLEELKIEYCKALEHVITPELEIDGNIESDGGHLHPPFLSKLTSLEINCCPSLEYVFKISLAQGLPQLKSVLITDALQLKQVFIVSTENNGVDPAIVLPRLQHLQLQNLINLSCFCSENYPIVSPSLEKLMVVVCPRLTNFVLQQEVNKQVQLKQLQLIEVRHDNVCITIDCQKIFQVQASHFLSMIEDMDLKRIHQLQGPFQVESLGYLRKLKVANCNRLKSLFSSMLARNLPQLNYLDIESCEELEEIIEMDNQTASIASTSQGHLQPISFPRLKCIRISECSNLKRLFPLSVIHSLSELRDMDIVRALKLEQVFGYQGELNIEDDKKLRKFPILRKFRLLKLPSLKSFAPIGSHFLLPVLENLDVGECPDLITSFSKDSKEIVHAITEAPKEVDNQPTYNDIFWDSVLCPETLPLYTKVEETENNMTQ